MLKWAIIFAITAAAAALLGFTGLAGALAGIAKLLFFTALFIFLLLIVGGLLVYRSAARPLLQSMNKERHHADHRQNHR
jgi:uncharacterized membrane protein YtjA (UPF0391 family)